MTDYKTPLEPLSPYRTIEGGTMNGAEREAAFERAVDAIVMRRLATDRAYLNAEDAESQSAREAQIEREAVATVERRIREARAARETRS